MNICLNITENHALGDPSTAMLAKWVEPHVIKYVIDCDLGAWAIDGDHLSLFLAAIDTDDVYHALSFWPAHGKVDLTERLLDEAADYMPGSLSQYCAADNPYACGCDDCREEVMLDRARQTERGATL